MIRRTEFFIAVISLVLSFALVAHAGYSYIPDPDYTQLKGEVDVNVPGMDFDVEGNKLSVKDSGDVVEISVAPSDLTTDLSPRDSDMREKILKNKPITMTVKKSDIKVPTKGQQSISGKLSLGGTSRSETVMYTAKKQGSDVLISAKFKIKLSQYGVSKDTIKKGPVEVGDQVAISVRFKVKE